MKKLKRVISSIVIGTLFVGIFSGCGFSVKDESVDVRSKVHFEGIGEVTGLSKGEIVNEINSNEENARLIIRLDNMYESKAKTLNVSTSIEEAQDIIMEHRKAAKKYYTQTNAELLEELELNECDVSFVADSYAPFLLAEFEREITTDDIEQVYKWAEADIITDIYVKSPNNTKPQLSSAIEAIDGTEIINDGLLDGTGITIGILDIGIVDEKSEIFKDVDLKIRNELLFIETVEDHATQVAACALAIAPNASILSAEIFGHHSGEIEWLLDNGVNIINTSFYYDNESEWGTYTSESAYFDYIAREYWVTFTCAAGNEGGESNLVTVPNGYNVLTVGASKDGSYRWAESSYEELYKINFPNFLAPGYQIAIPTFSKLYEGTSFAAPITAGTVALLMQEEPYLTLFPDRVMAILMASTQRKTKYAVTSGFNDEAGTGILNISNALESIDNAISFDVTEDSVGNYVSSKTIYLKQGQRIRVAFVSLVNNGKSDTSNLVTDYDLYLFNSSGTSVESSLTVYNNEFIDYKVTSSGYYTIKIKQYSAKKTTQTDNCSYAYYIE